MIDRRSLTQRYHHGTAATTYEGVRRSYSRLLLLLLPATATTAAAVASSVDGGRSAA